MSASNISAVTKTSSTAGVSGRCRVYGIYFVNTATASSFSLKDGSSGSGTAQITINTPAVAGAQEITIPDEGILFSSGVFIDLADAEVLAGTVLFAGGAAA